MAEAPEKDIFVELNKTTGDDDTVIYRARWESKDEAGNPIQSLDRDCISRFRVRKSYKGEPLIELTTGDGLTIDFEDGAIDLVLTKGHTANIPSGKRSQTFLYDWDLIDAFNNHFRLVKGNITFGGDV